MKIPSQGRRRPPRQARVHAELEAERDGLFRQVYALVRRIPRGRVMTYGQIAVLLESEARRLEDPGTVLLR